MNGPTGNSELRVSGKQNSLFPLGPASNCLLLFPRRNNLCQTEAVAITVITLSFGPSITRVSVHLDYP